MDRFFTLYDYYRRWGFDPIRATIMATPVWLSLLVIVLVVPPLILQILKLV